MNDPIPGVSMQTGVSRQQAIDTSMRRLWEKIRAAAQLIATLRHEKSQLAARVAALESELENSRVDNAGMDAELKRLRAERAQLMQVADGDTFTAEEKDILKGRIRELIAKINSHL